VSQAELIIRPFLIAFFVSLAATPLSITVFRKLGFLVDPSKTPHPAHIHKKPVPKGGGIPIFLALLVVALLFLKPDQHLIGIFTALLLTLVIGLVDDIAGLNPGLRLAANLIAALLVVGAGIGIAYITNPFGGGIIDLSQPRITFELLGQTREIWVLSDLFALIWIPFVMNAINWSSGVDGQVSGTVTIAAAVIGVLSFSYSADITQWPVATLAFGLSGAFAALTIFHFYPQKIMPGYSATTLAGLLLAVLSILSTTKVGTAMMVLGLPLVDATYTIGRRVLSGKSPFYGDRGHFHHRLLTLGWGRRRIAVFYWLVTAVLGVLALTLNAKMKLFAILAVSVLMAGFFLWIYFWPFLKQPAQDNG